MAKSGAERARIHIARKRQRARETGLCGTCCKEKPHLGLTTCISCNTAALNRQKRKRQAKREAVTELETSVKLIGAHERAGDVAREHHFYEAAAQHYEDALHVPGADESAWMRLSE